MKKWMLPVIMLVSLLSLPNNSVAQDGISRKKQEKILAKKESEDKKAAKRKEKEDRKHHLSIQDKETRKRLKRHTKRANRGGSGPHRDSFLDGLFRRKR